MTSTSIRELSALIRPSPLAFLAASRVTPASRSLDHLRTSGGVILTDTTRKDNAIEPAQGRSQRPHFPNDTIDKERDRLASCWV